MEEKQLLLKAGTIVDATIIGAPSSTRNAAQTRDPEMHQTRKGHQWYVGMKLHVGTDLCGLVHLVVATDAAADNTQLPALLHGQEPGPLRGPSLLAAVAPIRRLRGAGPRPAGEAARRHSASSVASWYGTSDARHSSRLA